jgi:hypothetical protein
MKKIAPETLITLRNTIARCTEINYHTESVLELATFLKNKDYINDLKDIILQHDALRYMPESLLELRGEIKYHLMEEFRETYGEKAYHIIKTAF